MKWCRLQMLKFCKRNRWLNQTQFKWTYFLKILILNRRSLLPWISFRFPKKMLIASFLFQCKKLNEPLFVFRNSPISPFHVVLVLKKAADMVLIGQIFGWGVEIYFRGFLWIEIVYFFVFTFSRELNTWNQFLPFYWP